MVWRFTSAAILLFWAVMTGFIIRDAYFPDSSRFAVVPPKFVFDLFLNEAAAFNNTLHLYHELEKKGHATFAIRQLPDQQDPPVYTLMSSGSFRLPSDDNIKVDMAFRIHAEMENAERWRSFDIDTTNPVTKANAHLRWKRGDAFPDIEVKRDGEVIMNGQMAQAMLAFASATGSEATASGGDFSWLSQLNKAGAGDHAGTMADAMQLHAREGSMDLAGKQRRCYIVTGGLPGVYEVKVFFTEVGELARIELPDGYRLLEPMMHGLEPELNTVE